MLNVLSVIATVVSVLFGLFYIWAKWKLTYWQRRGVPTLPTNLLTGNFTDCILQRTSAGFMLGRLHLQAEPDTRFLGVYIFQKPVLLLRDPSLIKQMYVKDFNVFCNRHFSVKRGNNQMSTHNLFSIDNPQWRYLRTKMAPAFSNVKLKGLFTLMVESSELLVNYLEDKLKKNTEKLKTIEVEDATTRFTTDIISSLAFGVRTNSFDEKTAEFYYNSRVAYGRDCVSAFIRFCMFFFPSVADFFDRPVFLDKTSYFRDVFWQSINAREGSPIDRGEFMDSLVKLKNANEDGDFKFDDDKLVGQSVIIFMAGLESSAFTMTFALYELAKQPDIQERVRKEILEVLNDGGLTYENVQRMKYLTQVINETMRLYPQGPILDRVATEDYKIPDSDVIIEKGTPVYIALPGLHTDPKYFSNPDKFDPDRFHEDNKIEPYTFMPFGEGPRICIGMKVGLLQTAVGIIRILQNYRVSVNPAYTARISTSSIFLDTHDGVHLYFNKLEC